MARNQYPVDLDNQTVSFPNGVVYTVEGLPEEMVKRLAVHGLKQKLSDAMAVSKDLEMSDAEKFALAQKAYDALKEGNWNVRGEGSGTGGGGSQLDQAAQAFLDGKITKEEQAQLAKYGLLDKIKARAKKLQEKSAK